MDFVAKWKQNNVRRSSGIGEEFENAIELSQFTLELVDVRTIRRCLEHFSGNDGSSNGRIILRHSDFAVPIDECLFWYKFRQLLHMKFASIDDFDLTENASAFNEMLSHCETSKGAFKHLSEVIAEKMMENNFSEIIQTFLNDFLFALKLKLIYSDTFLCLYDNWYQIQGIARLADKIKDETEAKGSFLVDLILKLNTSENRRYFVLIATHFPAFMFLLNQAKGNCRINKWKSTIQCLFYVNFVLFSLKMFKIKIVGNLGKYPIYFVQITEAQIKLKENVSEWICYFFLSYFVCAILRWLGWKPNVAAVFFTIQCDVMGISWAQHCTVNKMHKWRPQ